MQPRWLILLVFGLLLPSSFLFFSFLILPVKLPSPETTETVVKKRHLKLHS